MIEKVRGKILFFKDKKVKFRYNGSRNQVEEFDGIITACYDHVFIISLDNLRKSFSYSDVLIGVLDVNI